jgi:hypothetical protein
MLTDARGKEIKVGCRVAYNYSGQVAYGLIVSISKSGGTISIERLAPRDRYTELMNPLKPASISKVKNYRGILVLEDNE